MSEPVIEKKPRPARTKPKSGEARRFDRRIVHERCPVSLCPEATLENEATVEGVATDISSKGIGLITEAPISPKTILTITLQGRHFTHEFKAAVVWCRELPTCGKIIKVQPIYGWRLGLIFMPQTEDEERLLRMIAEQL